MPRPGSPLRGGCPTVAACGCGFRLAFDPVDYKAMGGVEILVIGMSTKVACHYLPKSLAGPGRAPDD